MAAGFLDKYENIPTAELVAEPHVEANVLGGTGEPDGFESSAPSNNIGLALLKRWPWLVVGVIGGLILGLLYHTQQSPLFQSSAKLLVIKDRPNMVSGGVGSTSMTMVEDYVTTQVTLLQSELIHAVAAKTLQDSQFIQKPPASDRDRVNYMIGRFTAMRERETGTSQMTNIVSLTFRSGNPRDAAQYLSSIIEAYRSQLATIYSDASAKEAERAQRDIDNLINEINNVEQGKEGIIALKQEMESITHEDLQNMRSRLTTNVNDKIAMVRKLTEAVKKLKAISEVGPDRQARIDMLVYFGGQPRQTSITTLESRNPQDVLFTFKLQRTELAQKYGRDHSEMQALDGRIRMLEQLVSTQGPLERNQLDELAVFERVLMRERDTLSDQIEQTTQQIAQDEKKIERVGDLNARREIKLAQQRDLMQKRDQRKIDLTQLQGSRTSSGYKVEEVTRPTDGAQVAPILFRSLLFGLFLGLVAGGGLALTMELTDRSFRSPAEIRRRLGLPILGHIPRIRVDMPIERPSAAGIENSLVTFYRPTSTEAEAYRGVRTQLYFSTQGRGHQVIQITSPNPGDGKSTLAANLAISIAQSGKRVVLIDCDFRKPRVHKIFMLPKPDVGLASVMSGDAPLMSAVQTCEIENLSLMPCGPRPSNPAELLTSPKFSDVLRDLREKFDFVIVDTPPVLAVSDPSAVAPRVDGVLLVFRMTKNSRPVAERAREQLGAVGARMLGIVVNASNTRSSGYGGYGYAYQYEYQYAESYAEQEPAT